MTALRLIQHQRGCPETDRACPVPLGHVCFCAAVMAMDVARANSERRTDGPVSASIACGPERAPLGSGRPDDAATLRTIRVVHEALLEDLRG